MEEVFLFSEELEPIETQIGIDPLASNYGDMITSILIGTPDSRLLPDNNE